MFRNGRIPLLPTLQAICDAFGISLSSFFMEQGAPDGLTDDQQALLAKWEELTEEQKEALLHLIDQM